jgi:hypothetical protein
MIELGYVVIALVAIVAIPLGFALAVNVVKRSLKEGGTAGTPEHIAYGLLGAIARAEGKSLVTGSAGVAPDRKWILDTFAECMEVTKNPESRLKREGKL